MIIATYGLPRSGKTTAAEHLETKFKLHNVSFGAGIYEEVSKAFNVSIEQLGSHEWKTEPQKELALKNCNDQDFVSKALLSTDTEGPYDAQMYGPRTSRFILQRWATEYRRSKDPLYWVKKLDKELKRKIEKDGLRDIVIPDLREFHEYQYLRNLSSELYTPLRVIEIKRAGTFSNGHSSDNALPAWCIDRSIINIEIESFRKEVERVVDLLRHPAMTE